jgi:hypothetical protein
MGVGLGPLIGAADAIGLVVATGVLPETESDTSGD